MLKVARGNFRHVHVQLSRRIPGAGFQQVEGCTRNVSEVAHRTCRKLHRRPAATDPADMCACWTRQYRHTQIIKAIWKVPCTPAPATLATEATLRAPLHCGPNSQTVRTYLRHGVCPSEFLSVRHMCVISICNQYAYLRPSGTDMFMKKEGKRGKGG